MVSREGLSYHARHTSQSRLQDLLIFAANSDRTNGLLEAPHISSNLMCEISKT